MKSKNLTEEEQELKAFMGISAITYLVVGLAFIMKSQLIWTVTNEIFFRFIEFLPEDVSDWFTRPEPQNMEYEGIWLVLAFTMMMTISTISFIAYKDIRNNKSIIPALLTAKLISSASCFMFFFLFKKYPLLLIGGLVDGFLFLITMFFYARAYDEHRQEDLSYFSHSQYVTINKAAGTIIPLKEGETVDVALGADEYFYKTKTLLIRNYTPLLIFAFEWILPSFILFIPFIRFTVLPRNLQEKYIERISTTRIGWLRLLFLSFKSILIQGYYISKSSWDEIEYSGPWVKEKTQTSKTNIT